MTTFRPLFSCCLPIRPSYERDIIEQSTNMSINLTSKVALVTGGSKGIGAATCRALAKAGASVVINYSSDSSAADALVSDIGSKQALACKADASSVKGAEEMVKAAMDKFGKLDIVVANAGSFVSTTQFDHMLNIIRNSANEDDRRYERV